MYIVEYTNARKSACLALDNLYMMPESFTGLDFKSWTKIINIENTKKKLMVDEKGYYVTQCVGIWFPFIILVRWDKSPNIALCQETNLIIL